MTDDLASLSRLHDLVEPSPVPWWPPAVGWYVVAALAVIAAAALAARLASRWRANAYRRDALQALSKAESAAAVSELLRRTALVVAPRGSVASVTGAAWPAWLAERASDPMPPSVRDTLAESAYSGRETPSDLDRLRQYAAQWIRRHKRATHGSEGP